MPSLNDRAVAVTKFFVDVPPARRVLALLLAFSFLAGFLSRLALQPAGLSADTLIGGALLFGGADGVLLLFLPALLGATLAVLLVAPRAFRANIRFYLTVSLGAAVVTALGYGVAVAANQVLGTPLSVFLLLANAFALIVWLAAGYLVLGASHRSLIFCFFQPLFSLSFLVLFSAADLAGGNPFLLLLRFLVAAFVLALSLGAFLYLVNAPARRNLGISTVQGFSLLLANWLQGSKGVEDIFADMGERVSTRNQIVAFRTATGSRRGRLKAAFLIPGVHYGPIGNVGGSEFPALLSRELDDKLDAPVFVFHAMCNHDFNPVYSASHHALARHLEQLVRLGVPRASNRGALFDSASGKSRVFGVAFGSTAFASLSRAPSGSEDIEWGLGNALRNRLLSRGFADVALADAHNSVTDGYIFGAGSREFADYERAIDSLRAPDAFGVLRLGVATDALSDYRKEQGVGGMGLRVAAFEVAGEKFAIVLVDANNAQVEFRNRVVALLHRRGYRGDLYTTDTHAVNKVGGVHNALGGALDQSALLDRIAAALSRAEENTEPVSAGVRSGWFDVDVLGAKRMSEVVTTANAILAVSKLAAPFLLALSVVLALIALAIIH